MAQSVPSSWIVRSSLDEIQSLRHEIQQLRIDLKNEIEQACANFYTKVHTDLQKLQSEIHPDLMRLVNWNNSVGDEIVPYRIVPFNNGDDPTQPPHNLPHLASAAVIEQLSEQQLVSYLTGYGVDPLPISEDSEDTDGQRKDTLVDIIGGPNAWMG